MACYYILTVPIYYEVINSCLQCRESNRKHIKIRPVKMFRELKQLAIACTLITLVILSNNVHANDLEVQPFRFHKRPIFLLKFCNEYRFLMNLPRDPVHIQIIGRF